MSMILVWLSSIYNISLLIKIGDISDNEDEGSTESETDHGTGSTKRTSSGGTTRVVNSNPQVTGNSRDKEKNSSGELEDADNPEAGIMSNDNSSS